MTIEILIRQLKQKLEDDLDTIGGTLLEFNPERKEIEVEVEPDTPRLRMQASLLIKDALDEYFEGKDKLAREENPLHGLEFMLNSKIVVD